MPRWMAAVAACERSVTPSLPSRLLMCVLTVASEMSRKEAISLLLRPWTICSRTSNSRGVSSSVPMRSASRWAMEGGVNVCVTIVGGEDDKAGLRSFHADALNDFDAREARHTKINERYVGLMFAELRDSLDPVASFADDFDSVDNVEQGHESRAYDVVIFDDENADGFFDCHQDSIPSLTSLVCVSLDVVRCRRTVVPVPISLVTSRVAPMR